MVSINGFQPFAILMIDNFFRLVPVFKASIYIQGGLYGEVFSVLSVLDPVRPSFL